MFLTGLLLADPLLNQLTSGQLISGHFTSIRSTSQPKPNPPLNPHPSSLADPTIPPHSASHAINIVFHVKHTRRTRHTAAAPVPSTSMLPHFAQLPPDAATQASPPSRPLHLPANPARAHRRRRLSTPPQAPQAPNRSAAVGPTAKPQHPNPIIPTPAPQHLRPQ